MGYKIGVGYQARKIGYQIGDGYQTGRMGYQIEGGLTDMEGEVPDRG